MEKLVKKSLVNFLKPWRFFQNKIMKGEKEISEKLISKINFWNSKASSKDEACLWNRPTDNWSSEATSGGRISQRMSSTNLITESNILKESQNFEDTSLKNSKDTSWGFSEGIFGIFVFCRRIFQRIHGTFVL